MICYDMSKVILKKKYLYSKIWFLGFFPSTYHQGSAQKLTFFPINYGFQEEGSTSPDEPVTCQPGMSPDDEEAKVMDADER